MSSPSAWDYLQPYRRRIAIGGAMLLATNLAFLGIPVTMGLAVEALKGPDPEGEVPRLAIFMIVFALATAVTRIVSRVLIFNAARAAEYDMRSQLFGHLLTLEPAYYPGPVAMSPGGGLFDLVFVLNQMETNRRLPMQSGPPQ